jgi:hypothetical protein
LGHVELSSSLLADHVRSLGVRTVRHSPPLPEWLARGVRAVTRLRSPAQLRRAISAGICSFSFWPSVPLSLFRSLSLSGLCSAPLSLPQCHITNILTFHFHFSARMPNLLRRNTRHCSLPLLPPPLRLNATQCPWPLLRSALLCFALLCFALLCCRVVG